MDGGSSFKRRKPLIGISCCRKPFGVYAMLNHAASDTYVRVVDDVVGGIPVLLPANGPTADIAGLLDRLDGIILTGSRSNVHPEFYGGAPLPEDMPVDPERDAVTLALARAAYARGTPLLAICRGLQELNVALGGTLHPRLPDVPGRFDHATPLQKNAPLRIAKAHMVRAEDDAWLASAARGIGAGAELPVNSLHNQGIAVLAQPLIVEATAPDSTIEAVRGTGPGYCYGVQWHPEFDFESDRLSRTIFTAFGASAADYATTAALRA
jgi:putative glutamine amidotransferase